MRWTEPLAASDRGADSLALDPQVRRGLVEEAAAGFPLEICGVLLGRACGARARATGYAALANVASYPGREYRLDPAELEGYLRADRVIGFYHSHPDGSTILSRLDDHLAWPGWWYVVVGGDPKRTGRLSAWRNGRRGTLYGSE